ncbi:MFS transporter [Neobacillus cucumis]|uniref:MFS transporter n=1 Tax=Neobacillus cucumis TaxID=1740721 RepID=UPI0018DF7A54|nr:MFS transporter [Neobacillus cucumis]MBI0576879.1 MFS transporter [Neobacillus cucumis]WHY93880.1 MFS transporter [Neobacillus cucumis]
MNKPKLWTKDFLIVSAANFFLYFTFYLLMVTITIFASEKFHASPSQAGLASGIFVVGTLIARLFSGRSIDRVGWKKMLYIGFILFLLTTLLYFAVNSLTFLLVNRFLNGAAMGVASTATGTIVAKIIPNARRGEGTGYYALSVTLAAAIGPFLGMFLMQHSSFNMNFIVCLIFLVMSFVAIFFLNVPKIELSQEQLAKMKGFSFHHFFEVKAIPISIIGALVGFGYSSILTFLTSYAKEINLVDVGSFFFIVYAVFTLISRPFTGKWFDQKGENFVMYPSFLFFAVALILLSQVHQGIMLLVVGALVGLGYATFSSSAQAISIKVSPKNRMGLATSTFFIFVDGGVGIGPFILGFFVPLIGYRGLYFSVGIVVFACIFLYYFLHGRKSRQRRSELVELH